MKKKYSWWKLFSFFPLYSCLFPTNEIKYNIAWLYLYQNLKLKKMNRSFIRKVHSHHEFSEIARTFDQWCPFWIFYGFFGEVQMPMKADWKVCACGWEIRRKIWKLRVIYIIVHNFRTISAKDKTFPPLMCENIIIFNVLTNALPLFT